MTTDDVEAPADDTTDLTSTAKDFGGEVSEEPAVDQQPDLHAIAKDFGGQQVSEPTQATQAPIDLSSISKDFGGEVVGEPTGQPAKTVDLSSVAKEFGGEVVGAPTPSTTLSVGGKPYVSGQFTPEEAEAIGKSPAAQAFAGPPSTVLRQPTPPDVQLPDAPQFTRGRFTGLPSGSQPFQVRDPLLTEPMVAGTDQIAKGVETLGRQLAHPQVLPTEAHVMQQGRPGEDKETMNALSDIMEGAAKGLTPVVVAAALADLPGTAATLGLSYVMSKGAEKAAMYAGADEDTQRFLSNFAGAVTALGMGSRQVAELRARFGEGVEAGKSQREASDIAGNQGFENARPVGRSRSGRLLENPETGRPGLPGPGESAAGVPVELPETKPKPSAPTGGQVSDAQRRMIADQRTPTLRDALTSVRADIDNVLERQARITLMAPNAPSPATPEGRKHLPLGDRLAFEQLPDKMAYADALEKELTSRLQRVADSQPGGIGEIVTVGSRPGRFASIDVAAKEEGGTPVDDAGRDLGGYAGPERRQASGEAPEGVERRKLPADQVREDLRDPDMVRQANAMREADRSARAGEPATLSAASPTVDVATAKEFGGEVAEEPAHAFGSTQANLPEEHATAVRKFAGKYIKPEDLTGGGVETQPHVTVKYGLHGNQEAAVREALKGEGPITVTLGKTTHFAGVEDGTADAVIAEVDSPDLHRLNKLLADAVPHTDTHPEYKPHVTIAYVQPGKGKDYDGLDDLVGKKITIPSIAFAGRDEDQVEIQLGGKKSEPETTRSSLMNTANVLKRRDLIGRIVEASRKPEPDVRESFELKGTNGKWYRPQGFPNGVYTTQPVEKRSTGWAILTRDGTTVGKSYPTREALLENWRKQSDRDAEEFRTALDERDEGGLQDAADYWLKKSPQKEAAPAPAKPKKAPVTEMDAAEAARLRKRRTYLLTQVDHPKLSRANRDENKRMLDVVEGKLRASGAMPGETSDSGDTPETTQTIYFRSGVKNAPTDFDGFADANVPVGVTADGMSKSVEQRVIDYAAKGGKVFIDSGAFGNPDVDFVEVLKTYKRIADAAGAGVGNLYVVAPDAVGDQKATFAIQDVYVDKLRELADMDVRIILPLQKPAGDDDISLTDMLILARRRFGGSVVAGIPFNKAAFTVEDVVEALKANRDGFGSDEIGAIHLLGIGEKNKAHDAVVKAIQEAAPGIEISTDSNRISALFGKGRPASSAVKAKVDERAPERIDNDWASDTTELAGNLYRGDIVSFTDGELEKIAEALNTTPSAVKTWSKKGVIQEQIEESGREPNLDQTLHDIAMARARKTESPKARRETITESEEGHAHRPGQLPERGGRTAGTAGAPGEEALAGVLPEPGQEPERPGAGGAGHSDQGGVVADGVRGDDGDAPGPETEPPARGQHVPEQVAVPPSGDTHDPGHRPPDYGLTPARIKAIIERGPVVRAQDNLTAIKIVKTLAAEERWATPAEQEALAKYVGWGASDMAARLADYPDRSWSGNEKRIWEELREVTTEEEREALRGSTPNAHFTYNLYEPIWNVLEAAGFTGGRVLEPSVGTGHAFGFMPADVRHASTLNAVEKEPLTAAIAHHLYPSARVQATGYEQSRIARGSQDLAIGNVPFGDFGVTDPLMPDFVTERIHNYFFAKALEHVRPGGLVVFLTSRYTLDAVKFTRMRRYLMEKADFVGAVRLPNTAFDKSAKTEVVTDVIVLRKLREGEEPKNAELFINSDVHPTLKGAYDYRSGKTAAIYRSTWYTEHPELVVGKEGTEGTMRSAAEYSVTAERADVVGGLEEALGQVLPPGSYEPPTEAETTRVVKTVAVEGKFKAGELRVSPDGNGIVSVDADGTLSDATPKRLVKATGAEIVDEAAVDRIKGMIKIRDARSALVAAMRSKATTDAEIKKLQGELGHAYDRFVKPHSKDPNWLNKPANRRVFKNDPEVATIMALEKIKTRATISENKHGKKILRLAYDVTGKADIFTKRTVGADPDIDHVDTPKDAMLTSLGVKGHIDWPYMAKLMTGGSSRAAIHSLKEKLAEEGLVFQQPDGSHAIAEEYLSGDVVSKLEDAMTDPDTFAKNIEALQAVQPAPKTKEDLMDGRVSTALGAHWVDPKDMSRFVAEQLGVKPSNVTFRIHGTETLVRWDYAASQAAESSSERHALAVHYDSNSKHYGFIDLVMDAINLKVPHLGHYEGQGKDRYFVREPEAELAARANQETLRDAWRTFVFTNDDVAERLLGVFNTRFNRTVERQFDGSHMVYPGMADLYNSAGEQLHFFPHQNRGVWRTLTSGNTLLAHEVGAGKTFEMIATAMEMRRTGRATKPMITVPTYLLKQWEQDIVRLYPNVKLLAFTEKDLTKSKRQEAMARIANGNWDIVLVPHSSFGLLKVSDERMNRVMEEWIKELEAAMAAEGDSDSQSVKEMERQKKRIEDKVKKKSEKLNKGTDNALTWEQLGVDALFVDEAQAFKNLFFFTKVENVRGLSRSEADRSLDLYVKIQDLNEQSNYRNLVLATATPVMNSIAEIYTMQRYLQPQVLKQYGIDNFDNWYAMFAQAVPTIERQPDESYKEVMRLRKYQNLQLLSKMVREVMDYVGWRDMPYLKLPKIKNNRIEIVQTEQHQMYGVIRDWFEYRMAELKANPPHIKRDGTYVAPERHDPLTGAPLGKHDNILTVMTDAKKSAVDLRLVLGSRVADWLGSRVQVAADKMMETYVAEKAKKGVQLVFLDMGTPKNPPPLTFLAGVEVEDETEGENDEAEDEEDDALSAQVEGDTDTFNLYDSVKAALVKRGVKPDEIAYIHQAKNPAERVALFEAANAGKIRFLLASTDKGGVGMNIQERLAAIHELDAPRAQRPGDLRQRMGRGIRQGNSYPEVRLVRYVTKGTTDEWLWGLLSTKDEQIQQFYRGDVSNLEEDDPSTMSLEEAQIRASNDPRGIELTELKGKMVRLEAQAGAAERAMLNAAADVSRGKSKLSYAKEELQTLEAWTKASFVSRRGKSFDITIGGKKYTDRDEAGKAFIATIQPIADEEAKESEPKLVAQIGDRPVYAQFSGWDYVSKDLVRVGDKIVKKDVRHHAIKVSVWMVGSDIGASDMQSAHVDQADVDKPKTLGLGQNPVTSLVNFYETIPNYAAKHLSDIEKAEAQIAQGQRVIDHPSDAIDKYRHSKARLTSLEQELKAESEARSKANGPQEAPKPGEESLAKRIEREGREATPEELAQIDREKWTPRVYTSGFVPPNGSASAIAVPLEAPAVVPYETNLTERPDGPYRQFGSFYQAITPKVETPHFWVFKEPAPSSPEQKWSVTHRGTGMSASKFGTVAEARMFAEAIESGRYLDPTAFDFDTAEIPPEKLATMRGIPDLVRRIKAGETLETEAPAARAKSSDAAVVAAATGTKPKNPDIRGEKGEISLKPLVEVVGIAANELAGMKDALRFVFAPDTRTEESRSAAATGRAHIAARDQKVGALRRTLGDIKKQMDGWSHDQSMAFWDVMEGISDPSTLDPTTRQIAANYRDILDLWRDEVVKRDLIKNYIENYWGHEWVRGTSLEHAVRKLFGRRPIQGPESFRKKRSIPTMREGIEDFHLEPVSWNPTEQMIRKITEIANSVMAYDWRADMKRQGLMKFVPEGQYKKVPPGWEIFPDTFIGTVYGPQHITVKDDKGDVYAGKPTFGRLVAGRYYGPPEVVRLIKNHLAPGLWGKSATFDLLRNVGNKMNMLQLGWSAFHMWLTGMESVVSKQALVFDLLQRGEWDKAARKQAEVGPWTPVVDLVRGNRALKTFYSSSADATSKDLNDIVNQIIQGGGGFGWSLFEHEGAPKKFMAAMRGAIGAIASGEYGRATAKAGETVARGLPALIELPTTLIMEQWVPRLKVAAFLDMAQMEIDSLGPGATLDDARRVLGEVWDSIDNRFGQLRYDNLFWHRTFRDMSMASVRAVGWNVGSIREMFGAPTAQFKRVLDNAAAGGHGAGGGKPPSGTGTGTGASTQPPNGPKRQPWLHRKMAWFIAMIWIYGITGAVYTYLMTGKRPETMKDYFFPKDDTGHRRFVPGYFHDLYSWTTHPVTTAAHKVQSILTILYEILSNEDYYGVEVHDAQDPFVKQRMDDLRHVFNGFKPFSLTNAERAMEASDTDAQRVEKWLLQVVSPTTPAPAEIDRSKAEQLLYDMGARERHVKTKSEAQILAEKKVIREGFKPGASASARTAAQAALQSGDISKSQAKVAIKAGVRQQSYLQFEFSRQPLDKALSVYEAATPEERANLRPFLMRKAQADLKTAPRNVARDLFARFIVARDLPVAR